MGKKFILPQKHLAPSIPRAKNATLKVNLPRAISQFEAAMKRFPIKKVLYKSLFVGKGLEFDSFREFGEGEDANLIDWKASLKSNNLLARSYIEEKNIEVYFVVDVSNSMLFGSGSVLKAEYAAEVVGSLAHLIVSSGNKAGLVMVNDGIVKFLQPSSDRKNFHLFSKFICDATLYGGGFNLEIALKDLMQRNFHRESVFIIVSDFVLTSKRTEKNLKLLGHRFETMAIMVRDPLDEHLPETHYQFAIQDPYSGKQMILDPGLASEKYKENALLKKNIFKNILKNSQIDLIEILIDKPFVFTISSFLKSRVKRGAGP